MSHEIDSPQFLVHDVGIHPFHTENTIFTNTCSGHLNPLRRLPSTFRKMEAMTVVVFHNGKEPFQCRLTLTKENNRRPERVYVEFEALQLRR